MLSSPGGGQRRFDLAAGTVRLPPFYPMRDRGQKRGLPGRNGKNRLRAPPVSQAA
ncbi:hypothetical protein HMPREF0372_02135, partial [Flavonifractor plautii ATCC 29863]